MMAHTFCVRNEASKTPVAPSPAVVAVRVGLPPPTRPTGWFSSLDNRLLVIWLAVVLVPWLLQVRSYIQLVAPHKISQDLQALDAEILTDQVPDRCPVRGIFIAGAWWNINPTHYYMKETRLLCHFVMPQFNMHGTYHMNSEAANDADKGDCTTDTTAIDYYFYHGSIGYYAFYEEGFGTYCADDWTATIVVTKLGSYDINGQWLAQDTGSPYYRQSYWFGIAGLVWILYRALVIRRSFIMFKRHLHRCHAHGTKLGISDAIVYIQESSRLTAHGATGLHRMGVLYLLLEGSMSDLFLFITKSGLMAVIQIISLCYNISGIVAMLFEMVEDKVSFRRCHSRWSHAAQVMKRLFFNHEITFIGEIVVMSMLQLLITSLNRSKLQDTQTVALAISYYAWSVMGHGFIAVGMIAILLSVRAAGAAGYCLYKHSSISPLTSTCSVEMVLAARQKLVLIAGYVWGDDGRLFYSVRALTSYGLLLTTIGTELYLVREKVNWFTAPRNNLVALAIVRGNHLTPCDPYLSSWGNVSACNRKLGGPIAIGGRIDVPAMIEVEMAANETDSIHPS
jgi:hypothetical protein